MSKRLDPNGLAGAFAKGPPTSLDFLVPQRDTPPAKVERPEAKSPAPKAKTRTRKPRESGRVKKTKTRKPAAKPRKTRRTSKPKTKARPAELSALPCGFAVIRRDIWTPGAPPPVARTWREALTQRALQLVGRVLSCVLP